MVMPTLYPEINDVLCLLLSKVKVVLREDLVGLYLYGSLASGDFDPETSDVDFLVVTLGEVTDSQVLQLEAMHGEIMSSGLKWAAKLEGSYLSVPALRKYNPNDIPRPCHNEGKFYLWCHARDWVIQRHILREHCVAVTGPNLKCLIDPVQPYELRQAVVGILEEWWAPMLKDPTRITGSDYQAYAVLTMCRALHALDSGKIVSKPAAARWLIQTAGSQWGELVEEALAWKPGICLSQIDRVIELIRFTLKHAQAQ